MAIPTCAGNNNNAAVFGDNVVTNNIGISLLSSGNIQLKRKFRYLFGIECCKTVGNVGPEFVKMASRPDITIEDTELNFLNETTWIPGKAKWETITVTYYDVASAQNANLFNWLASVYDFRNPCRKMSSKPDEYSGTIHLVMLDGCGNPIEKWKMANAWPTSIKFGELDYSSSDVSEIELTLRYSSVEYKSFCGGDEKTCGCTRCST